MTIEKSLIGGNFISIKTDGDINKVTHAGDLEKNLPDLISDLLVSEEVFSEQTECKIRVEKGSFWLANEPLPDDHFYGYFSVTA